MSSTILSNEPSSPLPEHPTASIAPARSLIPTPSSQSTISPAEGQGAAAGGSCCTSLCDLITKVIAAVCDFLSGLPLIGSCFTQAPEAPPAASDAPPEALLEAPPETPDAPPEALLEALPETPDAPPEALPETPETLAMQARISAIRFITREKGKTPDGLLAQALLNVESNIMRMLQEIPLVLDLGVSLEETSNQLWEAAQVNLTLQEQYMREVSLPFWTQVLEVYTAQKGLETADVNAYCEIVARTNAVSQLITSSELGDDIIKSIRREVYEDLRQTVLEELYSIQSEGLAQFTTADSLEVFKANVSQEKAFDLAKRCWTLLPENVCTRARFCQQIRLPICRAVLQKVIIYRMDNEIDQIRRASYALQASGPGRKLGLLQQSKDIAFLKVAAAVQTMANQVGLTPGKNEIDTAFDVRVYKESQKNSVHWEMYLRTVELPYWQCVQRLMNEALSGPESGSNSSPA